MIERQIEAPVLPGDDDGQLPRAGQEEPSPEPLVHERPGNGVYVEPGGLVEIAVNELGGRISSVEWEPDTEP